VVSYLIDDPYHAPIRSKKGENSGFDHCNGRLPATRSPRSNRKRNNRSAPA
jgi:hypothetical protein